MKSVAITDEAFRLPRTYVAGAGVLMLILTGSGLANIYIGLHIYWFTGLIMGLSLYLLISLLLYIFLRRAPGRLSRAWLLLTTLFVLVLSAEVYLRFTGLKTQGEAIRGYFVSPYHRSEPTESLHLSAPGIEKIIASSEYHYIFHTNSSGLSDREHPFYDEADTVVIGLGDSFTEGVGTAQDSGWLKVLEREFNSREGAGVNFMNAGVGGSDPVFEYRLLEEKLLVYLPDLVVVTLAYDAEDLICRGGCERTCETARFRSWKKWWIPLYGVSYLFRLIIHQFSDINHLFLSPEEYQTARTEALHEVIRCCDQFKELSEKGNFRLMFVFCPLTHELRQGHFDDWEVVMKHLDSKGIPYVDLLDYFRESGYTEKNFREIYWPVDGHLNGRGYALFAQGVGKTLRDELKKVK